MTFLQLCQALSRESGTVSNFGSQPSSVVDQVGRNAKIVAWVAQAWVDIQNMHRTWRFRRKEFTSALSISAGEYTANSFSLSDHSFWAGSRAEPDVYTLYDSSTGVSDETSLAWMPWERFTRLYRRGAQTDGRPIHWSVSPTGSLHVGPAPDKAYVFKGEYVRTAQQMTANADEPICPADYHMIIVWYALLRLVGADEAPADAKAHAATQFDPLYRAMANTELPAPTVAGARLA